MNRLRRLIRGERGFALPELLVATIAGTVVLLLVSQLVVVSLRESARVSDKVDATQRARIVLYQIIDELHSSCIAPQSVPVRAGSTDTSMTFVHSRGSAVTPVPVLRKITLTGTTLSESIYPTTGGTSPNWTFASTPTSSRELLDNVTAVSNKVFRYYAYSGGQISSTPLPTPLSTTNAAKTVQVTVTFDAAPGRTQIADPNASVDVENSALLRFSPPSYDPTATNAPCE